MGNETSETNAPGSFCIWTHSHQSARMVCPAPSVVNGFLIQYRRETQTRHTTPPPIGRTPQADHPDITGLLGPAQLRHVRYVVEVLRKVLTAVCSPLTHGVWQAHDVQPMAGATGCSRDVRTAPAIATATHRSVQSATVAGWSCRMAVSEASGDYLAVLKNANLENAEEVCA